MKWYNIITSQTGLIMIVIIVTLLLFMSWSSSNKESSIGKWLTNIGAGAVAIIGFILYNSFKGKPPQAEKEKDIQNLDREKKDISKDIDRSVEKVEEVSDSIEKFKEIKKNLKPKHPKKETDLKKAADKLKKI